MTIDVFTKAEWERQTAWPQKDGSVFAWSCCYPDGQQLVYEWELPQVKGVESDPDITFIVYSSIHPVALCTDSESGEDSIRVIVKINGKANGATYYKWPKRFWICRTEGWSDRLRQLMRDHLNMLRLHKCRCPDCHGMVFPVVSKQGKWYKKCFGKGCGRTYTGRDGKIRDRRFKNWI